MGPDPSIRKTGLIEDPLSSPKDGQDKSHNEVRELHDELACVTRIEVIGSVIIPRSKYILYAGLVMVMIVLYILSFTSES